MATNNPELVESHLKVYVTKNYSLFHTVRGNRLISPKNKKAKEKTMLEIAKEDFGTPILVDSSFGLIDGQHRYEARKQLNWPIYYMVVPEVTLKEIQVMNSAQTNWTMADFIWSLSDMGNENYSRFIEMYNKYSKKFGIYALLGLCSQDNMKAVQGGEMILSEEQVKITSKICDYLLEVAEYFKDATKIKFCRAYKKALKADGFSHKYFVGKLSKKRTELYSCTRPEQYLALIESIYNFNNKKGTIVLVPKVTM